MPSDISAKVSVERITGILVNSLEKFGMGFELDHLGNRCPRPDNLAYKVISAAILPREMLKDGILALMVKAAIFFGP